MTNRLINLVKKVNELNYLSNEYKLPKKEFIKIIKSVTVLYKMNKGQIKWLIG